MTTTPQILTADDLLKMSGDQRHELVRGELRTMPPSGFEHGAVTVTLSTKLSQFVRERQLGIVVGGEAGFLLHKDPDTVRGVDAGFVRADRVPNPLPSGYFPGAPDLAVEVISPNDTLSEIEEKTDEYLAAGTREVWVVNPRRQTVTVHRPGQDPVLIGKGQTLDGGEILPGFSCLVRDIFQ